MLIKVRILVHLVLKYQIVELLIKARLVKLVDTSDLKSDSCRISVQVR